MGKSYVEKLLEDKDNLRLFLQERSILEVTELLETLMTEEKVTRSELARRLGKSRGWVTQLLDGESNKTIRTVADAFAVLGREFRSFYTAIQISRKPVQAEANNTVHSSVREIGPDDRYIISMHAGASAIPKEDSAQSAVN